jgi:2-amino-4-hydroxy-6-hydroxymethyldihydropteridine diphosphokinase
MSDNRELYSMRLPWNVPEPAVDDPGALEAAETAVRGGTPSGVGPGAAGYGEADMPGPRGWRAWIGWPDSEETRHTTIAYVALGSNEGDRWGYLRNALAAMSAIESTDVLAVSNVYETQPWGLPEGGAAQHPYLNAVAVLGTGLRADQLLPHLQHIESDLGRVRGSERYGSRTIDLDILMVGDEEWDRPDLVVPHPRLAERAFVVVPLLELDPDITLPDGTLLDREAATEGPITSVAGAVPGYETRSPRARSEDAGGPLEFDSDFRVSVKRDAAPGDDWVAIEETIQGMMMGYSGALNMQMHLGILEDAGIPALLDPPPIFAAPGVPIYAAMLRLRLMVPSSYVNAARRALMEAHAAGGELRGMATEE